MHMVMTWDETQIQMFADFPMSNAKGVTASNTQKSRISCRFRADDKETVDRQKLSRGKYMAKPLCTSMYLVIGLKQTRDIKNVTPKAPQIFVGVAVYWVE